MSSIRYARWALAITAGVMPFYVLQWRIGPLSLSLIESLVIVTVALYAMAVWRHRAPLPRRTQYDIPIALFLLAGTIGVFVAPDHAAAFGILRQYLVEPVLMFYIGTAILASTAAVELLLAGWGAGAIVFAIIDVATFAYALFNGTLQPGHAAAAFGMNPNGVAMYLEPLIAMAAGIALFTQDRRRRAALVVLAALLAAELCTLSRGGLLALAALTFIALLTVPARLGRVAVGSATAFGAMAIWHLPIIGPRISHALDPQHGTVWGRERIWVATFRMLHDHPVLGSGLNGYRSVMAPYRAADNLIPQPYPHNIALAGWTELGLLGMAAFLYILISLIIQPWRAFAQATGFQRALLWGLGAAFVMIAVHGMVDTPYWKNNMSLEFWLLAALEVLALAAVRHQVVSRPSVETQARAA